MEKQLCIFSPTDNTNRVIALNQQIGCVVPYLDDVLLLATDDELKQYPHAGGIFRIQTNVKGCPTHSFYNNNIGAETL